MILVLGVCSSTAGLTTASAQVKERCTRHVYNKSHDTWFVAIHTKSGAHRAKALPPGSSLTLKLTTNTYKVALSTQDKKEVIYKFSGAGNDYTSFNQCRWKHPRRSNTGNVVLNVPASGDITLIGGVRKVPKLGAGKKSLRYAYNRVDKEACYVRTVKGHMTLRSTTHEFIRGTPYSDERLKGDLEISVTVTRNKGAKCAAKDIGLTKYRDFYKVRLWKLLAKGAPIEAKDRTYRAEVRRVAVFPRPEQRPLKHFPNNRRTALTRGPDRQQFKGHKQCTQTPRRPWLLITKRGRVCVGETYLRKHAENGGTFQRPGLDAECPPYFAYDAVPPRPDQKSILCQACPLGQTFGTSRAGAYCETHPSVPQQPLSSEKYAPVWILHNDRLEVRATK